MVEMKQGTIKQVTEIKFTDKGKSYIRLQLEDGTWAGYFQAQDELKEVKIGNVAHCQKKEGSQYWNVMGIEKIKGEQEVKVTEESFDSGDEYQDKRSFDILRAQCLNISGNMIAQKEGYTAKDVLDFAKELYKEARDRNFLEW